MILIFGNSGIYAQNANLYAFSTNNTGSFVLDRNGATVSMSSGTTQLIGSSQDDVASSVTNIGFSFNFMGTAFTQFTASSNGALRMGGSAISTTTIGTSFPVNNQSIIAPYLGDLETHSNGKVHYKLIGSSPNRTLVVEFLNMRINFNSTSSDATFQVRLYETTNVIEFVYGNMSVGSTSTASSNTANARSVVIGFSNDNDANEEISVNQSTYATTNSTTPIVNTNSSTGTITGLNGTSDGSRRRFTFIPPTVNTGTITGSPFCQGVAVTVPFTSSGTFTSNTYTAQLSSSTGSFASPTNIGTLVSNANSGNINATIPANATPGTGYRIRVNSSNANVLVFSNTVNLTVSARPTVSGATSVCVGASTNVTPSSGGTWSSSDDGIATVDNSGDVLGVSEGSATLTFTDGTTGCTNTVAVTVNGNSTLTRTSSVGTDAQTVCQNTAITNITYLVGGSGTGANVTGLPTGVTGTYNGGTKVLTISGSSSVIGSFNYTVTTTGPCGNVSLNGTLDITESSTLTLSSGVGTNIQTVCINNSINAVFYTIGGTATGAAITAGSLPTGVTGSFDGDLNEFSITGTPTVAGTFNFTVSSTGPCPVSLTGTITVNDNSTLSLFSGSDNQTRCINTAITSIVYQVGGGGTGGNVTGLPSGVTGVYNGGNKRITISGTPTVSGTFNYTVNTTGPCVNTSLGGTIVVEANSTITLTSANNNQTICENTALANITYSLGGGATGANVTGLPAGLSGSFDAGVYTIEGTATASGTFNYTVTATGPCVNPSLNGTIVVNPAPVVTLSANPGTVCFSGNSTLTVTNSGGSTSPAYTGSGAGLSIPNFSSSSYTYSSVTLNAGSETLSSSDLLQVTLNINHNEDQDLDIFLVDPSGTRAMLLSSDNGGSGNNYTNTVLSTAASNIIGSTGNNSAPFTGTFRPEGTITTTPDRNGAIFGGNYNSVVPGNALNGAPITGAWTLRIFDDGFATSGTLVNWSLSITKPAQAYVTTFDGPATITPAAPVGLNTTGTATVNGPVGANSYTATTTDALGCSTTSAAAIVTVNPVPDAPISGGDQTVCENGNPTQTLTATATGGDITWYDAATNGSVVASPVQVGVGSTTYYAEASNGLCNSFTRTAVTLTILAAPVAVGTDQTVCQDNNPSQTLTATAIGGTITWFDQSTGGSVVPSPVQVGVGTATYYAEASDGTCTSLNRAPVVLTINAAPAAPVSGGDQTVCQDGNPTQTLTATATGGTITWFDQATGGFVVPVPEQVGAGSITYYAESSDGTCSSLTRTPVTLTITAAPAAPTASNQSVCYTGNPAQTLTATATGGTITWYDQATGGSVVADPSQVGIGQSTYYAESFYGTCTSLSRTAVTLKINIPPATPAAIIGEKNVCPYVGTSDLVTYSIVPVPFAETYRWTLPPFVNLVSASNDSTSITVTFDEDFGTSPNRQIRVTLNLSLWQQRTGDYLSYFSVCFYTGTYQRPDRCLSVPR
ncbi:MAG: proprotein convertase P-domain-containing protein [Ferruginibacter sp.]